MIGVKVGEEVVEMDVAVNGVLFFKLKIYFLGSTESQCSITDSHCYLRLAIISCEH